jgi:Rha family phage regulatory protein
MTELVYVQEDKVLTTSRLIANKFRKQHKDVLKKIKNLDCSEDFRKRNFALTQIEHEMPTGGIRRDEEYVINRDGFTFLVMGFTGKEAAAFKEEYINAFNLMEQKLKELLKPKTLEEMIFYQAQSLLNQSRRLDTVEVTVSKLIENQELAKKDLLMVERSSVKVPEETVNAKIRRIVSQYVQATNINYVNAWNKVYDRL